MAWKRRQRAGKLRERASKTRIEGAFVVVLVGGSTELRYLASREALPGSRSVANRQLWFPRNLGDPEVSTVDDGQGAP